MKLDHFRFVIVVKLSLEFGSIFIPLWEHLMGDKKNLCILFARLCLWALETPCVCVERWASSGLSALPAGSAGCVYDVWFVLMWGRG